jgi:hypothetical protein
MQKKKEAKEKQQRLCNARWKKKKKVLRTHDFLKLAPPHYASRKNGS